MGIMVFNNEEQIVINGISKGAKLSELNRADTLNALLFARQITNKDDSMMCDLIDGTIVKVERMTDAEWDEIKMLIPFEVFLGDDEEDIDEE